MAQGDQSLAAASENGKAWANETLLNRPIYAFDLPASLLSSLQLRSIDSSREEQDDALSQDESHSNNDASTHLQHQQTGTSACAVCPDAPVFSGAAEKRAHLRSDWHRYNANLSKTGRQEEALREAAFTQAVEQLSSAESDFEDTDELKERLPTDAVTALLSKLQLHNQSASNDYSSEEDDRIQERENTVAREPHIWFVTEPNAKHYVPQTQFGVLRQMFTPPDAETLTKDWHAGQLSHMQPGPLQPSILRNAKKLRGARAADEAASTLGVVFMDASGETVALSDSDEDADDKTIAEDVEEVDDASVSVAPSDPAMPLRTWTIILLGGGDFSAIVVALNPYNRIASKRKGTLERQIVVIARKQFHRYTTRRKQGGAQSAQDASGRFAKSAGANLRRYGEQQLGNEIRELLDTPQWRSAIQSSEKVWVRAGLRSARGVLWSWASGGAAQESPLDEMRRRNVVQNLPIATRKPTVGECLRCFAQMTRVRVRHETEEQMEQRDAAYRAQVEGERNAREERRRRRVERMQKTQAKQAADAKKQSVAASQSRKLDPVEQINRERFTRMIEMIRKGRLESLTKHLEKYEAELLRPGGEWDSQKSNSRYISAPEPDDVDEAMELALRRINAPLPLWWRYVDARTKGSLLSSDTVTTNDESQINNLASRQRLVPSTLLQVAAEGGHESVVSHLLLERMCDPTASVAAPPHVDAMSTHDGDGAESTRATTAAWQMAFPHRTAYDLCSTREARDVFRRLMAVEPDRCDWQGMNAGGARVPKALTEEMQEARNKEEQVRDKRQLMRERARKREEQEKLENAHTITAEDRQQAQAPAVIAAAAKQSSSSTNKLGGSGQTAPRALQRQRDDAAGLTPEMRARIEREKRARAAEARFKALQGNH